MAPQLLLTVQDGMVTFGQKPLFEGLNLNIHQGDRIALVGKNGAGKTTMMSVISGDRELDSGEYWTTPNLGIGYLEQDIVRDNTQTVREYIVSHMEEEDRTEENLYQVDIAASPLELDLENTMDNLSGGQVRRASLAAALIKNPDILLLDEPTNHLDLAGIEWLEQYLNGYGGTLICISHDKRFLANITNKIFWLDRGIIRTCPKGFGHFAEWSEMLIEQERRELENRQKIVEQEMSWATRGVKARRKRNVRRLNQAYEEREKLKADKSSFRKMISKVELAPLSSEESSRVVAEFFKVHKSFGDKKILDGFNLRLMRGDKIGILGNNGSGKTSFIKLLMGAIQADMGKVKLAKNIEVSYFDQKRDDLNHDDTIHKTLSPSGGDYIDVAGKSRHVCGYLKDFLFDPKCVNDKVSILSGGQKNRLILARVLANPKNFLILDEPTNDLDMDTLEMLEDILSGYDGTLIVVSHDRDFLDQTVNKILAFEGDGNVEMYLGGYSDYLLARDGKQAQATIAKQRSQAPKKIKQKEKSKKLSYKFQHELDTLPGKIEQIENEMDDINSRLSSGNMYLDNPTLFDELSNRLGTITQEKEQMEERWLELADMVE